VIITAGASITSTIARHWYLPALARIGLLKMTIRAAVEDHDQAGKHEYGSEAAYLYCTFDGHTEIYAFDEKPETAVLSSVELNCL
jgi:hypothetical protein